MKFSSFLRTTLIVLGTLALATAVQAIPPLEVYGRLPATEMVTISQSGKRIARLETLHEQRRLIVSEGPKLVYSASLGDQNIAGLSFAGDDRILLTVKRSVALGTDRSAPKLPTSSLIVIPITTGRSWAIFEGDGKFIGGVRGLYGLSHDNRYGYFSGVSIDRFPAGLIIPNALPELYQVDLETRKTRLIGRQPDHREGGRDWLLATDGNIAATLDVISASGEWKIRNAEGKIIALGRGPSISVRMMSLGPLPNSIAYRIFDEVTGIRRLFEQPLDGSPGRELFANEPVRAYISDPTSRRLIGWMREDDMADDHFLDPRLEKVVASSRKAFAGQSAELRDWSDNFDQLLFHTSGTGDAGTWWLVDAVARTAVMVAPDYPLEATDVGPIRMVRYSASDGLDMAGVLTLPPDRKAQNLPVIILPHDQPDGRDYPVFDWWAQALASRGYAVFQPNYRGSDTGVPAFVSAGAGQWGRKIQTDISEGLAALVREGIADPKRACIMGAGYGGYAALAGVTLQQNIYRCAVSVSGFSDVAKLVTPEVTKSINGPTVIVIRQHENPFGLISEMGAISPAKHAVRSSAPILLMYGVGDTKVPPNQTTDMAAALKRAGRPVELITHPGGDQWRLNTKARLSVLYVAVAFLEKHNPPDAPATNEPTP